MVFFVAFYVVHVSSATLLTTQSSIRLTNNTTYNCYRIMIATNSYNAQHCSLSFSISVVTEKKRTFNLLLLKSNETSNGT